MSYTGAQLLAKQLRREGVEVIFGLPGIQLMNFLDALYDERDGIRFITTRHEQATTFMADGYARTSGRPGVALVVPGPGVYNAGAGLATAYATSSPVLLLAGTIEAHGFGKGLGLTHEIDDQLDVVRPATKLARRVMDAGEVVGAVREAFAAMTSGRPRPVELEFPPDLFVASADDGLLDPAAPSLTAPDPELVAKAAKLLAGARHPVVLAGGGVPLGGASAAFADVATFLQAAVVNTREGKGAIDERNPLYVGTVWMNKARIRPVMGEADVILAVGTRYPGVGLDDGQQLIHVDADPTVFGKYAQPTLAIEGDARLTLEAIRNELDEHYSPNADRTAEWRAAKEQLDAQLRGVGPQVEMVDALRAGIPDDGILVTGTTTVGYMCHLTYPVYAPRTYITSGYMGTLGYCYPTALGAKVARPDVPVVSINGDGGFLYCGSELATAMQSGINVVTIVFNDDAYGNTNRDQLENFGGRVLGTELVNPDFVAYAESFGAVGIKLKDVAELAPAMREAIDDNRSVVIELPMGRLPSPF
jgi:acetolactate synthase-1/2/3 large subunit